MPPGQHAAGTPALRQGCRTCPGVLRRVVGTSLNARVWCPGMLTDATPPHPREAVAFSVEPEPRGCLVGFLGRRCCCPGELTCAVGSQRAFSGNTAPLFVFRPSFVSGWTHGFLLQHTIIVIYFCARIV